MIYLIYLIFSLSTNFLYQYYGIFCSQNYILLEKKELVLIFINKIYTYFIPTWD